jgi:hypothetical protein
MRVTDPAAIERLLLYICNETSDLRRQLHALTEEMAPDELARIEGALAHIRSESTALLFSMPEQPGVH